MFDISVPPVNGIYTHRKRSWHCWEACVKHHPSPRSHIRTTAAAVEGIRTPRTLCLQPYLTCRFAWPWRQDICDCTGTDFNSSNSATIWPNHLIFWFKGTWIPELLSVAYCNSSWHWCRYISFTYSKGSLPHQPQNLWTLAIYATMTIWLLSSTKSVFGSLHQTAASQLFFFWTQSTTEAPKSMQTAHLKAHTVCQ